MKVGFISLGCNKNLVDTEKTIALFKNNGYEIVNNAKQAEIIVINTCGFIETAKEEAINTILEMAEYKNKKCKYLIVMGCLVQRYYEDLIKLLPEVDLFIKIDEYDKLWHKIEDLLKRDIVEKSKTNTIKKISEMKPLPMPKYEEFMKRVVTTGKNYAYIKIGEGCSNRCTYCAIPYIRGTFVSRKIEDILNEAEMLAKNGIKELIVIAQDTTKYGIDIYGESKLAELLEKLSKIKGIEWIRFLYSYPEGITEELEKLSKIKGIEWIRFLYSYPEGITEELIKIVANNEKIAKYFDIPIQHISDSILKKMNRKTSKENITKLIKNIKEQIPNVTLRTSLIVGFPGETKENFEELLDFVKTTKFDKLGTFMYSKEEGTPAAKLPEQIHGNTKKARYNKIMEAQQKISKEILKDKIDNIYKVLIEDMSFDGKYFIGRTMQDVPEEDGLVYIKNDGKIDKKEVINSFVNCKIENVNNYDLIGKIDKRGR